MAAASPEALGFPLLHDAADLTAAGIVLDADTHVAEPFPAHEIELLASQLAGAVEDVLGFGEADGVFSVIHSLVVIGYGIYTVDQARLFQEEYLLSQSFCGSLPFPPFSFDASLFLPLIEEFSVRSNLLSDAENRVLQPIQHPLRLLRKHPALMKVPVDGHNAVHHVFVPGFVLH